MPNEAYSPHSTFQRLLFRDTLDDLFRCGDCGATLVCNLGLGRVRDGELLEVPCPQCKETWTFTRTLSKLSPDQQHAPTDLEVLEHNFPSTNTRPTNATATCDRCGRELTNPKSIARGMGPDCARKLTVLHRYGPFIAQVQPNPP